MFRNYFKIAWRNLIKNKTHSFINITGLSVGMAVAILIGIWVYDEFSFDKNFKNYNHIVKVFQNVSFEANKATYDVTPIPLAEELRSKYPQFKAVSLSATNSGVIISYGEKKFSETGNYAEPSFTKMMSLKMAAGNPNGLNEINSIMLSGSLSRKLFDDEDPVNKIVKLNNKLSVKVTGVYEDLPDNSTFKDLHFLAPWALYVADQDWVKNSVNEWDNNSWQIYAQLKDEADWNKVSAAIKDIRMTKNNPPGYKPEFFLYPMSRWHLYADFFNGKNIGGYIEFVWLFGIIGIFVLLLACINFMNLSTARSEKRAREVGIRKAIGSARKQLILQFFGESLLVVFIAFMVSLLWVQLMLPFFNEIADKKMHILWQSPLFWAAGLVFGLVTGIISGSYPALYLSSFQPIKVLKGAFRAGRAAAIPRKVLVVLQFSVSVILLIGTIIVFRQVQFTKNRPTGYTRTGLIEINMSTPDLIGHYDALRTDLINSGAVYEMAESSGFITGQSGGTTNISWKTKAQGTQPLVMSNSVTHDYGKTIGWHLAEGRNFSRTFATDSMAMILNRSAVKLMSFKKPLEENVTYNGINFKVIGVVDDMIKESPFSPVKPSFFILNYKNVSVITIKLASQMGTGEALAKVENIFKKYNPASPFSYNFVDDEYGKKFGDEERVGRLASFFAILAIFISCLGIFGMASFMAEQRTREIGVRKVLGASIFNLWKLLSKEFVILVMLSLFIATPVAWYFMHKWLENYQYRTELSWWIFAAAGGSALILTLLTVSFQAIKAAVANPVKSLRTE